MLQRMLHLSLASFTHILALAKMEFGAKEPTERCLVGEVFLFL